MTVIKKNVIVIEGAEQKILFFINILITSVLLSISQLLFKVGVTNRSFDVIAVGILLYALGTALFILLLRRNSLIKTFPPLMLTYLWTAIFASIFLNEIISLQQIAGCLLMLSGVFLLLLGGNEK